VRAALAKLPMFARARPDAPGIYRTLQAFERCGLVVGRRRLSNKGPARREYAITPAGRAYLKRWVVALQEARGAIDAVIALAQPRAEQAPRPAGPRRTAGRKRPPPPKAARGRKKS